MRRRLPNDQPASRRFPAWVYRDGAEPDPRFSLANERTFLAWVRTALALIAGGVALDALALPLHPGPRLAASLLLLVLGFGAALHAWLGWARTERAMRRGEPLPSPGPAVPLAIGVAVVAVLVAVAALVA
ncbi:YidH family protein [Saccharothrix longispora]|uniref:Membrane protein n=1 Tax=Saccharothrix longispora TaxID=33920 RepID=A0ABU1PQK1_9PSEU|nr:DUF202 domain-containing protein [Saccharothrix longispora]MDR6592908.1 putative membrane protein [Saccharothrix longispora]